MALLSVQLFIALAGIAMADRGEFVNKERDVGRDRGGVDEIQRPDTTQSSPVGILDHAVSKPSAVHMEGCWLVYVQVEAERGSQGWGGGCGDTLW